uniref:WGS project CBMI000000000 data, contig CS3069_c003571 n=1 Tax=Fusarium clavum TaxID=2594811 RepID=A0A090MDU5_9HYPO|nr:unnamed protein product [Fusarium clavum]
MCHDVTIHYMCAECGQSPIPNGPLGYTLEERIQVKEMWTSGITEDLLSDYYNAFLRFMPD